MKRTREKLYCAELGSGQNIIAFLPGLGGTTRYWRTRVAPLAAGNRLLLIDLLGFGIVIPLLPRYATDYLLPLFPGESQQSLRGAILGLLMSSFSLMQFIFAPLWGRLSDRIGRRPVLLLGLFSSFVFYGLFGLASELSPAEHAGLALLLFFVARTGAGIAGATLGTAQAVIADSTTPEKRSRGTVKRLRARPAADD